MKCANFIAVTSGALDLFGGGSGWVWRATAKRWSGRWEKGPSVRLTASAATPSAALSAKATSVRIRRVISRYNCFCICVGFSEGQTFNMSVKTSEINLYSVAFNF